MIKDNSSIPRVIVSKDNLMNNYRNNRKNRFKPNNDRGLERSLNGHKNQGEFNSNLEFRHRNTGRNNQKRKIS